MVPITHHRVFILVGELRASQMVVVVKNSPAIAGDAGSIAGSGRRKMANCSSILGLTASIKFNQRPLQGCFLQGGFFRPARLIEGLNGRKHQGFQENQE